jgi:hypothetical protein
MAFMLNAVIDFWRSGFWFDVACLAAGTAVVSPFLLSKSLRKRLARSDLDVEKIGLIMLILALVVIGACNRFSQG